MQNTDKETSDTEALESFRTAARLAEAQTTRQRLAAIVDSSDDAIIGKTLDGIITSWNRGAERIFGYTAEEAIGRPKTFIFPPDRLREEEEILRHIRAGQPTDHLETVRVRKDGVLIDVSLTISPIRNDEGTIVGASTIGRDITEQKRNQLELARLNSQLRRAMRETHHRVKNNLQVICALLDMSIHEHQEYLPISEAKRISQQVMTLASIHDILTGEGVTGDDDDMLISSGELLHRLLLLLASTGPHCRLEQDIEDIRFTIRQATALALIVNELVLNAVKHGNEYVFVALHRENDKALLVVEDDGPGLPESFDALITASTGLALVRSLAQHDLGGSIVFENRPEGGARARMTAPVQFPAAA